MILKKIVPCFLGVVVCTAVVAALFFAPFLKEHFPGYSTLLFISFVIFFAGIGYAIVERNIIIGILAAVVTLLIPFMGTMLEGYWKWVRFQLHVFLG